MIRRQQSAPLTNHAVVIVATATAVAANGIVSRAVADQMAAVTTENVVVIAVKTSVVAAQKTRETRQKNPKTRSRVPRMASPESPALDPNVTIAAPVRSAVIVLPSVQFQRPCLRVPHWLRAQRFCPQPMAKRVRHESVAVGAVAVVAAEKKPQVMVLRTPLATLRSNSSAKHRLSPLPHAFLFPRRSLMRLPQRPSQQLHLNRLLRQLLSQPLQKSRR